MKNIIRIITLLAITAVFASPLYAQPGKTFTLSDRVGKNQSTWLSEAPLETMTGTAEGISGKIAFTISDLTKISGTVSFSTATMNSGNAMRDGHVKGSNWLDAAQYPKISFTISSASKVTVTGNNAKGIVAGKFTMHGKTKSISAPFTLKLVPESAATRKRAPGDLVMIKTSFTISLSDYNISGTKGVIGSKVNDTIKVTVSLFGATGL